jgi:hypothetical protein
LAIVSSFLHVFHYEPFFAPHLYQLDRNPRALFGFSEISVLEMGCPGINLNLRVFFIHLFYTPAP